jgi:hypothetical protein
MTLRGPNGFILFIVRCNSCNKEWPCDILAWSDGQEANSVVSKCNMPNCIGNVQWTGDEFSHV